MTGEDHFVAEVEADLAPFAPDIDRAGSRPRREIEVTGGKAREPDVGEKRAHWQIFAVRNKVGLIVAADDPSAGRDREDAVGGAVDMKAVARLHGEPAGQKHVIGPEQRS